MSTTQIDYRELVNDAEGVDADEKEEHLTYVFSNGKVFIEDDTAGIYEDE
jgi:hypothetical protein